MLHVALKAKKRDIGGQEKAVVQKSAGGKRRRPGRRKHKNDNPGASKEAKGNLEVVPGKGGTEKNKHQSAGVKGEGTPLFGPGAKVYHAGGQ